MVYRLCVPDALGVLHDNIFAGPVKGEDHVMTVGMGSVLVYRGNVEMEFRQYKRCTGDTGCPIMSSFPSRARHNGLFGNVTGL